MNVPGTSSRGRIFAGKAFDDLPNLLSLLVFFSVTTLLFRSLEFALIVTASLGFHELGHAALISYFRLEWRITFGVVGAWTWSPAVERYKLSNLANSVIHLAGPVFSLLLSLGALALAAVYPFDDEHLLLLANFSAQIAMLNLLPLCALTDGGKVARRVIEPLRGSERIWAALLPLIVTTLMMGVYTIAGYPMQGMGQPGATWLGLILVGVWMASSFTLESRRIGQQNHSTSSPLTRLQGFLLWLLTWALLALALEISALTPFWLAPEYVVGCLQNIADVSFFLIGLVF